MLDGSDEHIIHIGQHCSLKGRFGSTVACLTTQVRAQYLNPLQSFLRWPQFLPTIQIHTSGLKPPVHYT